jgi:uncharacterized protein DUF262/uncharacterized protein DUF1524
MGKSETKLDTDYGTFKDLVSLSRVYSVPLYQRRYAWVASKQVAELWLDVVRLYHQRSTPGLQPETHFIGSLVVGEAKQKALGPDYCDVIDGQQRITTLSLLVAAIRDVLAPGADEADDISDNYLVFPKTKEPRLVLSQDDKDVYDAILAGEDVDDTKSKVFLAYQWLKRNIERGVAEELDPEESATEASEFPSGMSETANDASGSDAVGYEVDEELAEDLPAPKFDWEILLEVVSADLEIVSISGVPAERAYQIFATLNHNGMRLTQVDLIRNAVFMKLPTKNRETYSKVWKPLEARLGERGLSRFLHAWVVGRGHNVPQKDTYVSVLQILKSAGESEEEVIDLLKALSSNADLFVLVSDPGSFEASKIMKTLKAPAQLVEHLNFLSEWGNLPAQPVLLEILRRWRAGGLSPSKAATAVGYVRSVLVRRFIAHIPPNDLRSTLARLVQQVRLVSDEDFVDVLVSGLKEPSRRWPDDDELESAFVTKPLYRGTNLGQSFLVLRGIAEFFEGKESPHIQHGTAANRYSIEHVLPQSVDGTSWISDMEEWGDVDPHQTWNLRRHTAGNLTLTAYNSELSNRPFREKRDWIEEHLRLKLSAQILEVETWTKKEIETRSADMAVAAMEVWPRA